ncbi:MAG: glycosyltransferase family 1 protein [Candidatus Moranbacteria bacterium]|nr:glycosyltransferase family 1 protein [Candidatus Moranbacteria bacterium]MDD3965113.1 glycosyltransferase family 1 protein [Candidatus Moranbacteria bacterium]
MRIGINTSFLRKPGTGIGQVTTNFLKKLVELTTNNTQLTGCEFILYCEESPQLDFVLPENFQIRVFLPFWKRDDLFRRMLWEKQLAREVRRDACDVLLSLSQSATVLSCKTSLPLSSPVQHIMIVHDIIPEIFPEYRSNIRQKIYWQQVRRGIRHADHIVAVSQHTKKDLIREYILPEKQISVIYPSVNPRFAQSISLEQKQSTLRKYHLEAGYIYHGGGLEIRKNTESVLRAYAELIQDNTLTSQMTVPPLVISGKIFDTTNKLATDVRGLIRSLRIEERVILLGFVPDEDLPALYSGALFFVYPSFYEGFGLPVLEAMSLGIPVLTSDTSSLPEVGGTAVLYAHPDDSGNIQQQMKQLLIDENLRQTLSTQSAIQRVQFSWVQFTESVLALLKK